MKITFTNKEGLIYEVFGVNGDIYPGEKGDCLVVDGFNVGQLMALLGICEGEIFSGVLDYEVKIQGEKGNLPTQLGLAAGTVIIPRGQYLEIMLINGDASEGDIEG